MKVKAFALAGAAVGSMFVASTAPAAFTGVTWEVVDQGAVGGTTYRFYAEFDDPTDQLLAINGDANVSALTFSTNTVLQNDPIGAGAGTKSEDFPFLATAAWDSWVTIGVSSFSLDNNYSPGFLGGDGSQNVIKGSSWSQADNGGWFDSDPTSADGAGGFVLIAQFTVADVVGPGVAGDIEFGGTVSYNPGGGPPSSSELFFVSTPAPGALALLGLAGLAGTRRRRA